MAGKRNSDARRRKPSRRLANNGSKPAPTPGRVSSSTPRSSSPEAPAEAAAAAEDAGAAGAVWSNTRAGARAGRGYHFQDVVGAWLCSRLLSGELTADLVVPEGPEDLSCEGQSAWQVQVKSRQERVGDFSASEVAGHVLDVARRHTEREAAGLAGRPVLVLERPVAGELLARWGETLSALPADHALRQSLRTLGASRGLGDESVESAARLVGVYVLPWRVAAEQTRDAMAARHGLLPAAAEPAVLALRNAVAVCADANAQSSWTTRSGLNRTAVESVTAQAAALIDRQSLEDALASGLCEPLDFDSPLDAPSFYEGVEVQPGHIAAGLPEPRPDVTGRVVRALEQSAAVLVTGPSGVGKSTVMWAAAYATRHILWYRVHRLRDGDDVEKLVRLVRACGPSERSPVGLVIDAVGVGAAEAWDVLERELASVSGTVLLGSVRNEDLLPLRTLPSCAAVEVRLDEEVAARIHAGLIKTGATSAAHWREAFDAAAGLTLEYTHLLSRGRRLSDVLREQVRRRVIEGRGTELQIIARVATAHRWATELPLRRVESQIGADEGQFRAALARLHEEHLVHVRGTRLAGLHQLRSAALAEAVHELPPPALEETVPAVMQLLDDGQLQAFVVGVLIDAPHLDPAVLAQLGREIERRGTPEAWTAVLQALRLVDFHRRAGNWAESLGRHGVPPAHRPLTLQLALLGSEPIPQLRPDIVAAVAEIGQNAGAESPLRDCLLAGAYEAMAETLRTCADVTMAARFLGVLAGSAGDLPARVPHWPADSPLVAVLAQAPAGPLGDLLAAALAVSQDLALALFEASGGKARAFAKLRELSPWVVELGLYEQDGRPVARARLLHVSDRAQPDVDQAVRDFARVLLRCLPACESVDVQALLPGGTPIQIGDYVSGQSRLQRRYDHSATAVAWNRLRSQVAAAAAGTVDPTARALAARTLVVDAYRYTQALAQAWAVSRDRPGEAARLEAQRVSLRARADALTLPVIRADLFNSPVDETAERGSDELHTLVQGIADSLTSRMHATEPNWGSLAAFTGNVLRKSLVRVGDNERWALIAEGRPGELDLLDELLADLHAVLAEMAWGGMAPSEVVGAARAGAYPGALRRVADLARSRAAGRSRTWTIAFRAEAQAEGLNVEVWSRPSARPDGVDWPAEQIAIGVHVATIAEWTVVPEKISQILPHDPAADGGRSPVLVVPLVDGSPLRLLARQVQTSLWPGQDLLESWTPQLGPPRPTPLTEAATQAHQALQGLSGVAALVVRRDMVPDVANYAEQEALWYRAAMQAVEELDTDDAVVAEVAGYLRGLADRVQAEFHAAPAEGSTLAAGIAVGVVRGSSDDLAALDALLGLALQWDVSPGVARQLLDDL